MDPLAFAFGEISPYSYVLNSPLVYMDPYGDSTVHVNKLDWQKFNPDRDDILLDAATVKPASVGDQVMNPVAGFWGKTDQFLNGNRRYYDGREVDKQGKLTAYYKPISGSAPDISPAKGIALVKLLKSLMDYRNAKSAFKLSGQLSTIWNDRKMFLNWLKNNHSLS